MAETVLFISHEATRTGAPIVLLHLLRWWRTHGGPPFVTLLGTGGGALEPAFRELGPCTTSYPPPPEKPGVVRTILRFTGIEFLAGRRPPPPPESFLPPAQDIKLIYCNTAVNGDILDRLEQLGCPVVTHVHELDCSIRAITGAEAFGRVVRRTTHFIAASQATRDDLVTCHGIPPEKIDVIHSWIDTSALQTAPPPDSCAALRASLAVPPDALLVCACGHLGWEKGPDLFLQVASRVRRTPGAPPVQFLWVGGSPQHPWYHPFLHDLAKLGLSDCVRFVERVPSAAPYFAAADLFALTSRVESMGLVMLEAAALGRPTVCFRESGGPTEFVGQDCGIAVPYLDVDAMAAAVLRLAADEPLRRRIGTRAAARVREAFDVEVQAPKVLALVRRFL